MFKKFWKKSETEDEEMDFDFQKDSDGNETTFCYLDKRRWFFDLKRLEELCFLTKSEKGPTTTETTEVAELGEFSTTFAPVSKTIREITTKGNSQNDTMRYDLIKMFLGVLLEKESYLIGNMDLDLDANFSLNLSFTTLKNLGIIKEITDKKEK